MMFYTSTPLHMSICLKFTLFYPNCHPPQEILHFFLSAQTSPESPRQSERVHPSSLIPCILPTGGRVVHAMELLRSKDFSSMINFQLHNFLTLLSIYLKRQYCVFSPILTHLHNQAKNTNISKYIALQICFKMYPNSMHFYIYI